MRGCLSVLLLAAVFVLGLAWFGGPALAGTVVERSMTAAGFVAADTSVSVTSEPPLELLTGHADRVVIKGRNATLRDIRAASLSLTLSNVDLVGRRFARVDGTLDNVSIDASDGTVINARSITVRGPADATTATIRLAEDVVKRLLTDGIRAQAGLGVGSVTLSPPNRIKFTAGLSIDGRFDVGSDGSLGVVTSGGGSRFTLFEPPPQLRLTNASVVGTDLVLVGTISVAELIR
jgi:hypothetical protein